MARLDLGVVESVPGEYYGTPKELWGFRLQCARAAPNKIARQFLKDNAQVLGLEGLLTSLHERDVIRSLGATHVMLQQHYQGHPIHRGFATVHYSRDFHIYLVKNRCVPRDHLGDERPFRIGVNRAKKRALREVGVAHNHARFLKVQKRWFPVEDILRPAYRVRVQQRLPREDWSVYVDAYNGRVLSYHNNLSTARGIAHVFDPNPVIALGDHEILLGKGRNPKPKTPPSEAYSQVVLRDLVGNGRLDGKRVRTSLTKSRVKSADHKFLFTSRRKGFLEAMVYYHIDAAIRYLESLGYLGARAIFTKPIKVNAHATALRTDQSWYDPGTKTLSFGRGPVDDAEDADTIFHEFGHALQDAVCPDFGQSNEAAAMGEGFGDYFAASYFDAKRPKKYRTSVMTWDAITYTDYDPPCLRRIDLPLTYSDFEDIDDNEHENGKIWSAALWDVHEAFGQAVADKVIIESHFQLDGFTTFARGARAIIDADRNLFGGEHVEQLKRIFRTRLIGPVG